MTQTVSASKLSFWKYRLSTVLKSFKQLYSLSPEKVQAFLDSYSVFDNDWADEKTLIKEMGADYIKGVQQKLVDYYCVLNHLCSVGQVEKMYIPPAMDLSKSIMENQKLYEQKVAHDLGLTKASRVLDLGCGRGRVANHIASHTGAHVSGVNIDTDQLETAKKFAASRGMTHQCDFHYANMNIFPYPFKEATFDGVYEIQVLSYCKNLEATFKELHRVLKPGGKLAMLDWVVLDAYNPKNPHHAALMPQVKAVIAAVGNPSIANYTDALRRAGFKILVNQNASIDGLQAPLIQQADKFYTRLGRLLNVLVRCKILPKHFETLFERLSRGGPAFVEADLLRLVSTSHYILAEKV